MNFMSLPCPPAAGWWIISSATPWVATADPPKPQGTADHHTFIFNYLGGEFATCWIIAAKPVRVKLFEKTVVRTDGLLINSYRLDCNASKHFFASVLSSAKSQSITLLSGKTTISQPSAIPLLSKNADFIRRRQIFLSCALARVFLETTTTSR